MLLPLRLEGPFGVAVSDRSLTMFDLLSDRRASVLFLVAALFILADYIQNKQIVNEMGFMKSCCQLKK
jgi:hypothetical protein